MATSFGRELAPADLYRATDPAALGAESTAALPPLEGVVGQPRAFRALEVGTAVRGEGFNIFVLGLPSSGRTTLVQDYLARKAADLPSPDDLCYVHNFAAPDHPRMLRLPAGQGSRLRSALDTFVTTVRQEMRRAFSADAYRRERDRLASQLQKKQEEALTQLQIKASKLNFAIVQTPFGLALVPAVEGKPLSPEELEKLDEEKKAKLEKIRETLQGEVEKTLEHIRKMEQEARERLQELNRRTTEFVVGHLVEKLKAEFPYPPVEAFLDAVREDIIANAQRFLKDDENDGPAWEMWARRYRVNVVVDNGEQQGAPVVLETHPSYYNLLGRIEHEVIMGATRTDHTLIRAGALHRANGGFLLLPMYDLLVHPYAWDGLKRALRTGKIRILELGAQMGWVSTVTLDPEPVPLHLKVVLIGTPMMYYLLRAYDEDFGRLFKVRAEFADTMPRTEASEREYALFIRTVVEREGLPHFRSDALARVIEHGARLAEDQSKLSTRFGQVVDLLHEAAYWAQQAGHEQVTAEDVSRAIREQIYRANLLEERIQEEIAHGVLLIDVEGKAVGRINALSVVMLGDYAFGHPTRVSATAYPSREGDVVDIERRAELGGPIHTKGVLILGGFLGWRYGRRRPLNLLARLTFEQSYGGVEGDSASAAELLALLSAIAQVPLRQDRAITGSINQHGQIQAIGGVNEKIEGFFATCQAKGLTGEQGVIIPEANVRHLMLREEVRQAVAEGRFHIWAVRTVDEAIALLTDMPPGEPDEEGNFPEGTFNRAVQDGLDAFAEALKREDGEEDGDSEEREDESEGSKPSRPAGDGERKK